MSAVGLYRSPIELSDVPAKQEDPLFVLYQKLERLCVRASDPYEIAAHLEAIGYNRYRVQREFGLDGVFKLAERLYALVPREFPPVPSSPTNLQVARRLFWKYLAVLSTFSAILAFYLRGGKIGWAVAIWLLAWSQASYFLVNRAEGELDSFDVPGVRAGAVLLGALVTLALSFFSSRPLDALAGGILWVGVTGMLWEERARVGSVVGAVAALGAWLGAGVPGFFLAGAPCIARFLARPFRGGLRWLLESLPEGICPGIYGLGQGLLLYGLFRGAPLEVLCGATAFALVWASLLDFALHRFAVTVNRALWESLDFLGFFRCTGRALITCTVTLFLPLGAAGGVSVFVPDFFRFYFVALGLWALTAGAGTWLFSLGERRWPAGIVFFAGVVTVAAGDLWIPVSAVASLALLVCLVSVLRRPVRYGVWFL